MWVLSKRDLVSIYIIINLYITYKINLKLKKKKNDKAFSKLKMEYIIVKLLIQLTLIEKKL